MKISGSIRKIHEDQKAVNDRLKKLVDERVVGLKNSRWHYESRVKELSSFALKLETGRVPLPAALEDFFACTLVVANAAELVEGEKLVKKHFTVAERRPKKIDKTHKQSDSFPFDDLRMYATLREGLADPPTDLSGIRFEVQLKTFLQHAWSIATHDLLYKAEGVSWSKERIAYQIKAMLEHAEISIQEAEGLAACAALAKEDPTTTAIKSGIKLVKAQWGGDQLPTDIRRLARNITALLEALRMKIGRLEAILNEGKIQRKGTHPANLSPYGTIVQYLFDAEKEMLFAFLKDDKVKTKILIPAEIEIPKGMDLSKFRNAVFVPPLV